MTPHLQIEVVSSRHTPVLTSQLKIEGRRSCILSLRSERGVFLGEASPLEGYGEDSFALAESSLQDLRSKEVVDVISLIAEAAADGGLLSGSRVQGAKKGPRNNKILLGSEDPVLALQSYTAKVVSPSARFCIEMLVLAAVAERCCLPLHRLLVDAPVVNCLPLSAVLDPHEPDVVERALRLCDEGVHTFKLKCGWDEEREAQVVWELASRGSEDLRLRLDPNRAWSPEQCVRVMSGCSPRRVQWIEDPSLLLRDWAGIHRAAPGIPLAIDEALVGQRPGVELLRESAAGIVVLKPMALGGFGAVLSWAKYARECGLGVCISHLFDGPLAFDATTELAFCVQTPEFAPGLGEHAGLSAFSRLLFPKSRWLREKYIQLPTLLPE